MITAAVLTFLLARLPAAEQADVPAREPEKPVPGSVNPGETERPAERCVQRATSQYRDYQVGLIPPSSAPPRVLA